MITKTIMDVTFNAKYSLSSTLSLPTEEIFQVTAKWACGKFSSRRFSLSAARNAVWLPKPLNTYISVFLFVYWFSFPSKKVCTSLFVSDTDFSVLAAIIPENSHKLPWVENGEGFAVHSHDVFNTDKVCN